MRVGDFGVEVVPVNDAEGVAREIDSGHVLARPGTVYKLRLRNFGPLRCIAQISIDGTSVTESALVLDAYSSTDLERPIGGSESGRFTVIAEGDERVFGPDGGRDNPNLGLIEVRFRRELPSARRHREAYDTPDFIASPLRPEPSPRIPPAPGRPMAPPEWKPGEFLSKSRRPDITARAHAESFDVETSTLSRQDDRMERAAGTGLTGHSTQTFVSVTVGPLEDEATVVRLRIVVGTEEALAAPRPLPRQDEVPARPAARP